MSLRAIGPVMLAPSDYGDPQLSWSSAPTASGQRAATISGSLLWKEAQFLSELLDNTEQVQTIGMATGVLETLWFDDELFGMYSGWYVLQEFSMSPSQAQTLHGTGGDVSFSLKCSYLGANREAVVVYSSRSLANDFDVTGVGTFVDPFAPDGTNSLLVDVGGTLVAREYDPIPDDDVGRDTEPLNP